MYGSTASNKRDKSCQNSHVVVFSKNVIDHYMKNISTTFFSLPYIYEIY